MPTYDYICLSCGNRFEEHQGMNEDPLDKCPECRGAVKRLITGGTGYIMKDGGTRNITGAKLKPACGRETTCCGRDSACGKSTDCR